MRGIFLRSNGALAALLATLSFNVSAALIDNGTYTTDTVGGRDWLDLTETTGISFDDLVLQLTPGGALEEWELAKWSDVTTLFDNAGGDGSYNSGASDAGLANNLFPIWGTTDGTRTWFYTEDVTPGGNSSGGQFYSDGSNFFIPDNFSDPTEPKSFIGGALYRTSVVPIPAAVWLFGSALGLVGFLRRRAA